MTRAGGVSLSFLVAAAALATSVRSFAAGDPRPLTVVARSDDPALRRLRAELGAIGLRVQVATPSKALSGTRPGALLRVRRTADTVTLEVETPGPPPRALRDVVVGTSGRAPEAAVLCARAVELVRASQYVPSEAAPGAPDEVRDASAEGTPTDAEPLDMMEPRAAPVEALPASGTREDDVAPAVQRPRPASLTFEMGAAIALSPGGLGPAGSALLAVRWYARPGVSVGITGLVPVLPAQTTLPEGDLRLSATVVVVGARYAPIAWWGLEPAAEAGVGALVVDAMGTAHAPFVATSASTATATTYVRAGVAFPASSFVRLRVDALLAVPLGRPIVLASGEARATWGVPIVLPSVSVEAKW